MNRRGALKTAMASLLAPLGFLWAKVVSKKPCGPYLLYHGIDWERVASKHCGCTTLQWVEEEDGWHIVYSVYPDHSRGYTCRGEGRVPQVSFAPQGGEGAGQATTAVEEQLPRVDVRWTGRRGKRLPTE